MAMTQREKMIAGVTAAALGLFVVNRYGIDPYIAARRAVGTERAALAAQNIDVQRTFTRQKRLDRDWRVMVNGGLKSDAGDAEQQLYESVRDWAREAGVVVLTSDPQRVTRNERTQIVRLRVTGTATTASFSKLLWKVETSPIPVKVDEFTLTSRSQGNDDLAVTMAVSTLWVRPPNADDARETRPGSAPRRTPVAGKDQV